VSKFYSCFIFLVLTFPMHAGCTVVSDYGEDYLAVLDTPFDAMASETIGDSTPPSDVENGDSVPTSDASPHSDAIQDTSTTEVAEEVSLPETDSPTDADPVEDNGPVTKPSDKSALFEVRGHVHMVEYHDYTGNTWQTGASDVSASLKSGVTPHAMTLASQSDQCRLYLATNPACDPACTPNEVCTTEATCESIPTSSNGGKIVISGLQGAPDPTNLTLGVTQDGSYAIEGEPLAETNLFEPGASISVAIKGSGDVAPTELTLNGVNDMQYKSDEKPLIRLKDSANYVFAWDPTGQEELIELTLKTGPWLSGQSPEGVLVCTANDAGGSIVIPKDLVASFPYFDGKTNDQHPSYVRRLHRAFVDTDSGPIDVSVISESYLFTIHEQE
jgi:hypothetical protein